MKARLQITIPFVLLLLAGNAFAQTITAPTVTVSKGATAAINLNFSADGATTNFDFSMAYDETVVDESRITVACDAAAVGITTLNCAVNTLHNTVKGIGVNLDLGSPLVSGNFAVVSLPVLVGTATGDSGSTIAVNFSDSGSVTAGSTTWTITVTKANQTITGFAADPTAGFIGGSSELSATASSGLAVTSFASTTPSVCTVAGSTVNYIAVGTCTVTADQTGDANYNAAPQSSLDINVTATAVLPVPAVSRWGLLGLILTLLGLGGLVMRRRTHNQRPALADTHRASG